MSKSKIVIVQGKNNSNIKPQHWHNTNVTRVSQLGSDEFKYGFPSDGLDVFPHTWWGSNSKDNNNKINSEKFNKKENKSEGAVDHSDDAGENNLEKRNEESNFDLRGTSLLSHLRKRAAKEGKEALNLGVYRGFDVSKVGKKEKKLLFRVFKSSFPSNQKTGPSYS